MCVFACSHEFIFRDSIEKNIHWNIIFKCEKLPICYNITDEHNNRWWSKRKKKIFPVKWQWIIDKEKKTFHFCFRSPSFRFKWNCIYIMDGEMVSEWRFGKGHEVLRCHAFQLSRFLFSCQSIDVCVWIFYILWMPKILGLDPKLNSFPF